MAEFDADKHCGAQRPNQPEGVFCTRPKGWGTEHLGIGRCKRHGGSTPSHEVKAQREIAEQLVETHVRRTLGVLEPPKPVDPYTEIGLALWARKCAISWVEEQIATLEAAEVVWARTQEESGRDTGHGTGMREGDTTRDHAKLRREAKVNVWVNLWNDLRREHDRLCVQAIGIGIAEREIKLAEQQGQMVADALRAIFADPQLGLSAAQLEAAPDVADRHLRFIAGSAA